MAELDTEAKVQAYLDQIFPSETYSLVPFELGWVCQPILSPAEMADGMGIGLTNLVIDTATGVVTEYPSWSTQMVVEDYTRAKRSGRPPAGGQIYPYQWRIAMRRVREDTETIEYQMTVVSLNTPPEPSEQHPLRINKMTFMFEPTDTLSSVAMSYAQWGSSQNQGQWPEEATTEV